MTLEENFWLEGKFTHHTRNQFLLPGNFKNAISQNTKGNFQKEGVFSKSGICSIWE